MTRSNRVAWQGVGVVMALKAVRIDIARLRLNAGNPTPSTSYETRGIAKLTQLTIRLVRTQFFFPLIVRSSHRLSARRTFSYLPPTRFSLSKPHSHRLIVQCNTASCYSRHIPLFSFSFALFLPFSLDSIHISSPSFDPRWVRPWTMRLDLHLPSW